jgi:hypothetical protein
MNSSGRYYGVGLLDDLHTYFPALLYQPERFSNVASVLEYIRSQAQGRFDLFSNAQSSWRSREVGGGAGAPAAAATGPRVVTRGGGAAQPVRGPTGPNQVAAASQPPSLPSGPRTTFRAGPSGPTAARYALPREEYVLDFNPNATWLPRRDFIELDNLTNNLVSSMLNPLGNLNMGNPRNVDLLGAMLGLGASALAGGGGGGAGAAAAGAMDPVIIRPTAQQIAAATAIEIVDAEEEVCAICQDDMEPGSNARSILACDHRFHPGCIDTWFQRSTLCPVCRHDIRESGEEPDEAGAAGGAAAAAPHPQPQN